VALHYLVAYDIRAPKRLRRVAKVLEDFGLRVQKSVFIALLDERRFFDLKAALRREIDPAVDEVAFVRLCRECLPALSWLGPPPRIPRAGAVIA
jgi:CRISPR-associated protein Cas2